MLSTIIGFLLSISPVAIEAPEDNLGHEINKDVGNIHIGNQRGTVSISGNKGSTEIGVHGGSIKINGSNDSVTVESNTRKECF